MQQKSKEEAIKTHEETTGTEILILNHVNSDPDTFSPSPYSHVILTMSHLAVAEIQRPQLRGIAQHRQVPRDLRSAEVQHFQVLQATQRRAQLPGHVLAATCVAVL